MRRFSFTILASIAILLNFLFMSYLFVWRPANIKIEDDLTCRTAASSRDLANYTINKYGDDLDFNEINEILYSHGYYLRNFSDSGYIYISHGDGSPCWTRKFAIDTGMIRLTLDKNMKMDTLGD